MGISFRCCLLQPIEVEQEKFCIEHLVFIRSMTGDPIRDDNGVVVGDTPASTQMKVLGWTVYAVLAVVILVAIMWIARDTLDHYFGFTPFGDL